MSIGMLWFRASVHMFNASSKWVVVDLPVANPCCCGAASSFVSIWLLSRSVMHFSRVLHTMDVRETGL